MIFLNSVILVKGFAALNYLDWTPDVVHCHDWQAALVPLYLRTCFKDSNVGRASCVLTIHNLRFQGIYDRKTIQYWSGLPDYVFNKDCSHRIGWMRI